jgi:S-adenosylmethionine:tRNA ribosyltransferase-isomerase
MTETADYDYELPEHLIAAHPVGARSDARLLIVDRIQQSIAHGHVRDLAELLRPSDSLVINDTRVVPARLVGRRTQTSGRWEGLYLRSGPGGQIELLAKCRGKQRPGETIQLIDRRGREDAVLRLIERRPAGGWIAVLTNREPPLDLLTRVGRVPLPHYIRRGEMVDEDLERYQTVYAEQPGSVAAPTAGLHFSRELLARIEQHGVEIERVTLHVGLGTFRPITTQTLEAHEMHGEWCELRAEAAERLARRRSAGGRIVAVGTTSARTLETAAAGGALSAFRGETNLFIRPPYTFHAVDALLTNFHLPRSTLLVLVRALGGDDLLRRAYAEAIREEYRFYSYGDAMLIL